MAALTNGLKLVTKWSGSHALLWRQAARNMAGWNKDYKPGPYPITKEEYDRAAKKYNLLPEEYRPYADDGLGYGDYPKLDPGMGNEAKDPYYPYDFPEHKRNFNQPLHADIDMYGEDRVSVPTRPRYTVPEALGMFLAAMVGSALLYYWLDDKKMFRPVAAKQYPGDGKKHYTFETE